MKAYDFTTTISVKQSAQEVFAAICNVRAWWSQHIEGSTNERHDKFRVDFRTHWWAFEIEEMIPYERITWRVTDSYMPWNKHKTEWTGTKISFEISGRDDNTGMQFTHTGLHPSSDCYNGCSKGWIGYIHLSLAALIRTGKGTPDVAY